MRKVAASVSRARSQESSKQGSAHVMAEAREQDAFQKRVDAAEASIAKLTRKAEQVG